ncbi:hypothetical protein ACTVOX_02110 [Serratia marcescens]|uniref:hypothetical protein n=1 Tax=Serratia marcescens TaxID=615 RepID=UPI003FA7ABAC
MNFTEIRQTMTDDAWEIVSALTQAPSLTLQSVAYICDMSEYATRFILEQMALTGIVSEAGGNWSLTRGFQASAL